MSFFMRYPRLWIVMWSIFGLGGLIMAFDAFAFGSFDALMGARGVVALAAALMMVGYIARGVRAKNA